MGKETTVFFFVLFFFFLKLFDHPMSKSVRTLMEKTMAIRKQKGERHQATGLWTALGSRTINADRNSTARLANVVNWL